MAVGDFNGDGKADLAVANEGSGTVSVLLGHGDGTFAALPDLAVGTNPFSVAVGDFNGDGKLDLAVANFGSNTVSVLRGDGTGTFVADPNPIAVASPVFVAVGDFNRDGHPDLAVADRDANTVSVLQGKGDGTFLAVQTLNVGIFPVSVAVGDFNGDGIPDLAVANADLGDASYSNSSISVLIGTGNGTFQPAAGPRTFTVGDSPWSVTVGDFNGDGKLDLAVANRGNITPGLTVAVVLGNGDGTFVVTPTVGVGSHPSAVAVYDFNGDGKLDLAVANAGSNTVSVLLGNGDGTFQSPVGRTYPVGGSPASVAVGDFDGDGIQDLAVANYGCGGGDYYCTTSSTTVTVLFGNGDGTFGRPLTFNVGTGPNSVAVGDFNRDGHLDLAVANYGSTPPGGFSGDGSTVSVLLGTVTGSFTAGPTLNVGHGSTFVAVGDFNGDTRLDLAVANYGDGTVSVLLGNGDGTFRPAVGSPYPVGGGPWSVAVSDFNGDGKPDLAVATYLTDLGTVSVLLGNGDGTFGQAVSYPAGWGPMGPISVAVADFNGDGIQDLAVANFKSTTVSVLLGNVGGTFQAPQGFDAGIAPGFVAVADVNGDGLKDLIVPNLASNTVSVLLGAGLPSVTPAPVLNPAGGTFILSVRVTITDGTAGAAIYYTTDGSTPTTASTLYTGPITVTKTTTIKAIAQAPGLAISGVTSGTYTILVQAAPPT
ncbi:MAG: hypothetical protein DME17_00520, partial [Candidatus Rokuibacteriota bacterium]